MDELGLGSIPMPPEPPQSVDDSNSPTNNDAWKKAQEALQKIQATSSREKDGSHPTQGNLQDGNIQKMLKAYPWMTSFSMPFAQQSSPMPSASQWWPGPSPTPNGGNFGNPVRPSNFNNYNSVPPHYSNEQTSSNPFSSQYNSQESQFNHTSAVQSPYNNTRGAGNRGRGYFPPPGLASNPQLGNGNSPNAIRFQFPKHFRGGTGRAGRGGRGALLGSGPFGRGAFQKPGATGGNMEPLGSGSLPVENESIGSPPSVSESGKTPDSVGGKTMPDGMTTYIEKAYMAVDNEEDKNKVETALRQKLMPLLNTGSAWAVDWEREPLPTDPNFKMNPLIGAWTPAAQLKKRQQEFQNAMGRGGRNVFRKPPTSTSTSERGRKGHSRWRSSSPSPSPDRDRHKRKKRSDSSSTSTTSSNDSSRSPRKHRSVKNVAVQRKQARWKPGTKKQQEPKKGKKLKKWEINSGREDLEEEMKKKRAQRFSKQTGTTARRPPPKVIASRIDRSIYDRLGKNDDNWYLSTTPNPSEDVNLTEYDIVGTCRDLEKPYFRLTVAPDPAVVRAVDVLKRSLEVVKRKWKQSGDYRYACDQLRSIRQDLTVQRIRSEFTIEAYETHARIALEQSDREEFNQCQTQLRALYRELPNSPNESEFTAYRLLYFVLMENTMEMGAMRTQLSDKMRQDPCVQFALDVQKAWAMHSSHRLFRLYAKAPKMAAYAMDLFAERERKAGLRRMLKSYRPSVPLSFVSRELGFGERLEDLTKWLKELSVPLSEDGAKMDCRQGATLNIR